ncbi:hypothetical protein AB0M36_06940 [Actinoplanes sp. NPDC051346]
MLGVGLRVTAGAAAVMMALMGGLGRWWARLPFVRKHRWLI